MDKNHVLLPFDLYFRQFLAMFILNKMKMSIVMINFVPSAANKKPRI